MDSSTMQAQPGAAPQAVTPGVGLLVLGGVVVVIAAFIWLAHLVGVTELWVAFLFLLYWAGLDHHQLATLPKTIVGATVGLLMAWSLHELPLQFGNAGFAIFLGIILVAVYLQIVGWATLAINMSTMLFLTVGTIPMIQSSFNLTAKLMGLAAGIVYFAGLVLLANRLQRKSATK